MRNLPVFVNCDICGVLTDEYVIHTKKLSCGEFDFFTPLCFDCNYKIEKINSSLCKLEKKIKINK